MMLKRRPLLFLMPASILLLSSCAVFSTSLKQRAEEEEAPIPRYCQTDSSDEIADEEPAEPHKRATPADNRRMKQLKKTLNQIETEAARKKALEPKKPAKTKEDKPAENKEIVIPEKEKDEDDGLPPENIIDSGKPAPEGDQKEPDQSQDEEDPG